MKRFPIFVGLTVVALGLLGVSSAATSRRPGSLDRSFGRGGKVTTHFVTGHAAASDVVIQPNGKIVVAGSVTVQFGRKEGFALARYTRSGSLDRSFGKGGRVIGSVSGFTELSSIALQHDGKLVATGFGVTPPNGPLRLVVARYLANGSPDPSFGKEGEVFQQLSTATFGLSVAVRGTQIYVAGALSPDGADPENAFIERLKANGTLDRGFGNHGIALAPTVTPVEGFAEPLVIQSDGKILIGGSTTDGGYGFALARFNPDGSIDQSFANYGHVETPFGTGSAITWLAEGPNGEIIAAGYSDGMALARYSSSGELDRQFGGFGAAGKVVFLVTSGDESASGLTIQRDGKILVAGTVPWISGRNDRHAAALIRLTPAGVPDPTFGHRGIVVTRVGKWDNLVSALALQRDGKVLLAGTVATGPYDPDHGGTLTDFGLLRYRSEQCTVPNAQGMKLGAARRSLVRNGCRLGHVDRRSSALVPRGRVISEQPRAGRALAFGAKVKLVLSKGRRKP